MTANPFSLENKIQSRHQDRLAIIYVRQSTIQQIEKHSESTKLQYALVNRALQLGWPHVSNGGKMIVCRSETRRRFIMD